MKIVDRERERIQTVKGEDIERENVEGGRAEMDGGRGTKIIKREKLKEKKGGIKMEKKWRSKEVKKNTR